MYRKKKPHSIAHFYLLFEVFFFLNYITIYGHCFYIQQLGYVIFLLDWKEMFWYLLLTP